ncbi:MULTISPECIES: LysR family transcriptional regulator [unclassified Polynucleobacter]|uniref:LysR family transcriptional regulator n=1 Tax=unclassified Polynucleobacter TaxID=2640945 RepID=UPI0008B77042|nr:MULTISPECIES: LysR family transcriptional regulator [unclassified Polynucleobacter]OHC10396.1 MAG: LysR family transcriptional regulator [Polynucleobacter sp. GWA2_45_21]HBK44231.1 LysR family transcriptional regulator [Polynucleobacter sp.]
MSSIRILKNFLAITRHKSVAAAAKEIGLTAAAAGQQLAQLESELGVELFDRTKRSLSLNHQGRSLIEPIQDIVARYEALGSELKSELSGTIVLGALVSTLMGAFGSTLNKLKQTYPSLEVKLIAGLSSNFLDQVLEGSLDAAIVTESPYALPQNIQWTELYTEPMVLIYPTVKNAKGSDPKNIAHDLPFIRFERNTWTGHLVDQTIRSSKLNVKEGMELNSVEAIIELVRQGLGYSIVPKLANIAWESDRQLKISALPGKTIYRKVGLLEKRKHSRQNMTQEIKKYFLEQVGTKEKPPRRVV